MSVKLTEEQEKVVEAVFSQEGNITLVNALAGTGKTTTCFAVIQEALSRGKRCLYLVFNKAMEQEAKEKAKKLGIDDKNLNIKTVHALAYMHLARTGFFQKYTVSNIRVKDIYETFTDGYDRSYFVLKLFNEFLYSEFFEDEIEQFFEQVRQESPFYKSVIEEYSLYPSDVRKVIESIEDHTLPCPHDYYLKKFISMLKSNELFCRYDTVILDESQDANPCFASLLKSINANHLLFVGDRHQWIYGFRGSVNFMEHFEDIEKLYLTHSFRFGENIAEQANIVLQAKGEKHLLKSDKKTEARKKKAILSRTNAELLRLYLSFNPALRELIVFERGIEEIVRLPLTMALIRERMKPQVFYEKFKLDKNTNTRLLDEGFLRLFKHHVDLMLYIKELEELNSNNEGGATESDTVSSYKLAVKYELDGLVDVLEEYYKHDRERNTDDAIYMATAHSAKGQEYRDVVLLDDFPKIPFPETPDAVKSYTPELNLLYVALTRASQSLTLSDKVKQNLELLKIVAKERELKKKDKVKKTKKETVECTISL